MEKFAVHMQSGDVIEKEANSAVEAKKLAKAEQNNKFGRLERSDPRVATLRVEKVG